EGRKFDEGKLLRGQFSIAYESIKPFNVLQKMINQIASPSKFKDDLIQTSTGLITGYISRKMLVRSSKNPLLRLTGIFVQSAVTNFVANNSASIIAIGSYLINKFTGKFREYKR
ncbi:MAG: hypothetical protein NTY07_03235, partial [Bacteroidia bacterium]|nr:hypothetical protein [Bacteroidia bacterium]